MEIVRSDLSRLRPEPCAVITIGSFDGLHLGHQALVQRVVDRAREAGCPSALVTFSPHPRQVLDNRAGRPGLLCDSEERIELLKGFGLDRLVVLNFTPELAAQSAEDFIRHLLKPRVGFRRLVIGHDHAFGHKRSGNRDTLRQLAPLLEFELEVLPPVVFEGAPLSSTRIRRSLQAGQVAEVARMLGRHYSFRGTVVAGKSRGRELGFPTANLRISVPDKLLPSAGVYAVRAILEGRRLEGMMNLGSRPTFAEAEVVPEVHLFDFADTIYGMELTVELVEFERHIIRFEKIEDLLLQLQKDRKSIQGRFAASDGGKGSQDPPG